MQMEAVAALDPEQIVLGSLGYSSTVTPWGIYHALKGGKAPNLHRTTPLQDAMEASLREYLEQAYDVFLYDDAENREFAPSLMLEPIARIAQPGKLQANPGSPLIIEMPSRGVYEQVWQESFATVIPFRVRARAQMRMKATGAKSTLLWLVSDFGQVDEFHSIAFDEQLTARMLGATNDMLARVVAGEEPDPEDSDLQAALEQRRGLGGPTRIVDAGDPLLATIAEYDAALAKMSASNRVAKEDKETVDSLKNTILRELLATPVMTLPDGRRVTTTVIRRAPSYQKESSWTRLDIEKPKK